jgi:hypothetical protein
MNISADDYIEITSRLRCALNLLELLKKQDKLGGKLPLNVPFNSAADTIKVKIVPNVISSNYPTKTFTVPSGFKVLGRTVCGVYIVDCNGRVYRYTYSKKNNGYTLFTSKDRGSRDYKGSFVNGPLGDALIKDIYKKYKWNKYSVNKMYRSANPKIKRIGHNFTKDHSTHYDVYVYKRRVYNTY